MIYLSVYSKSFAVFQRDHIELILLSFFLILFFEIYLYCAISCCSDHLKDPKYGYPVLVLFTLSLGYFVSICTTSISWNQDMTPNESGRTAVILAGTLTLAITIGNNLFIIVII